jgi:hypothetical protein
MELLTDVHDRLVTRPYLTPTGDCLKFPGPLPKVPGQVWNNIQFPLAVIMSVCAVGWGCVACGDLKSNTKAYRRADRPQARNSRSVIAVTAAFVGLSFQCNPAIG